MKVDGSLKSLLQGVSQQPPRDRLPGQAEGQINMSADPVTGLTRRPPTDLVGTVGIQTDFTETPTWYDFETKNGNKYITYIGDNTIRVYNSNAVLQDLTIEAAAQPYLNTNGTFVCAAQEDKVYIANKIRVVQTEATQTAYANIGTGSKPMGIIQVLGGAYGRKYKILQDGVVIASMTTVDGSSSAHAAGVTTTYIAEVLAWLLVNAGTDPKPAHFFTADGAAFSSSAPMAGANWTVTRVEDVIRIRRDVGAAFLLSVSDDQSNVNMKAMTESVPDVSDLPRIAPQGYVARVATEVDPEEDMWLEFVVETQGGAVSMGSGFGKPGYWQECAAPGIRYRLDAATMPHVLEYDEDTDEFTFRQEVWADRNVGTTTSNPDPSFVGNQINDISNMQQRLVILAGKNAVMSRTKKPTDFWLGSVSALVDSDPIDISSNAQQTSKMIYAIPHNRDLVIFAEKGQFIIFGRTALTPANAAMVLTTSFEASLRARPSPAGRNVFFAISYGRFAGLREFYTEGGTDINDTRPITQHIKKYIEGTVTQLSTASNYDLLFVLTDASNLSAYVYQFIWSDTEKVQSAWSKWTFPHSIKYVFFDRDVFYLIVQDGGQNILLRMPIDVEDSLGMEFPIYLDERFDVFNVNTQFTLPYAWLSDEDLDVVQGPDCPNPGMRADIDSVVFNSPNWVVTLKEDMEGGDIVVGVVSHSEYSPTMPLVKDGDGVVVGTGALRASHMIISMDNTGDLNCQSTTKWGQQAVVKFQGRIINDTENVVGEPAIYTGQFQFPIREKTDRVDVRLFTEGFYPMTLLDIEWKGQYNKRGKRISTSGG